MPTQEMMRRQAVSNARAPRPYVRGEDVDFSRLCNDMTRSRLALRYPRESRRDMIVQYAGKYYSEESASEPVPINLLALYINIVGRGLIAKNPRAMMSTFQKANKPTISTMQQWVNDEADRMNLAKTLQRWVVDALFSIGIIKVALSTPSDAAHAAWSLESAQPFVANVSLDDFVCDMHARDFSEVSYIGHRYRVPLDTIRDSSIYTKARKLLTASTDPLYNQEGDTRANVIGRTTYGTSTGEEFEEMVDLWEVYLPRRKLVVTFESDNAGNPEVSGAGDVLRVQRWLGPDDGPYHILGFQVMPDNLLPKAPLQDLFDLHMLANNLYRKLTRQAERQKTLLLTRAPEDAARIQTSSDGDIVRVDNPDAHKLIPFDNISQLNMQLFIDCVQRFSFQAGNMEMMGGLSPQSKTATQDKLLASNASGTLMSMQETVVQKTEEVYRAMCWFQHHDPVRNYKAKFEVPGMPELSVMRQVGPQDRQRVPWDELQIKIDPYSLQSQTPQARLMMLQQVLTQIIMPLMPLLKGQGIIPDLNAILRKFAEYQDNPDLQEFLTIVEPPQQDVQTSGGGEGGPQAPEPDRVYNRMEMPGRTQQGDNMNALNALKGINPGGAPETGEQ